MSTPTLNNSKRVVGIDPGYDRCGIAILESQGGKEVVRFSTCVETKKQNDIPSRIYEVATSLKNIIETEKPTLLALERLYFNTNQKTAISVAETRGALLLIAKEYELPVVEFTPQQIKLAVTGYGKSDKEQVAIMLKKVATGVPQKALDDEYDAIAVALTGLVSKPL